MQTHEREAFDKAREELDSNQETKHLVELLDKIVEVDDFPAYAELATTTMNKNGNELYHCLFGIQSEVGELASAIKKHLGYDKPFPFANVIEEFGDILWFAVNHNESLRNFRVKREYGFFNESALLQDLGVSGSVRWFNVHEKLKDVANIASKLVTRNAKSDAELFLDSLLSLGVLLLLPKSCEKIYEADHEINEEEGEEFSEAYDALENVTSGFDEFFFGSVLRANLYKLLIVRHKRAMYSENHFERSPEKEYFIINAVAKDFEDYDTQESNHI